MREAGAGGAGLGTGGGRHLALSIVDAEGRRALEPGLEARDRGPAAARGEGEDTRVGAVGG